MTRNFGNLPDEQRCIRTVFDRDEYGNKLETKHRCKKPRMTGIEQCETHSGSRQKAASAQAKVLTQMQKFVVPIAHDDPEADIVYGFEMEYRRTVGRIRFCDEQIGKLASEREMIFGLTKLEEKSATEWAGTDTTYEARINTWYVMQMGERKHLLEMQKIWIGAKLDAKRLEINQQYVIMLDQVITGSLKRLGLDAEDPQVRQIIREELLALPAGQGG